jgi:hypothetical protein
MIGRHAARRGALKGNIIWAIDSWRCGIYYTYRNHIGFAGAGRKVRSVNATGGALIK